MKRTIEKIEKLRDISLNKEEANQMFADFSRITGMEQEPIVSNYFVFSWQRYASYATLVVFLGLSTLSYAAEGSLPGDLLYPIKTKINESVIRTVTYSGDKNAEVAILERRLDEAQELKSKGELKNEVRLAVKDALYKQIDRASPDLANEIRNNDRKGKEKKEDNVPTIMMMSSAPVEEIEDEVEGRGNKKEKGSDDDYKDENEDDNDDGEKKKEKVKERVKEIIEEHKEIIDEIDNIDLDVGVDL